MHRSRLLALLILSGLGLGSPASAVEGHGQPYAGQETRAIKALSPEDVDDLLAGRGWGLALPAELNGYPGPAHVLELAGRLDLDPAQQASVQAIFERMRAEAQELGAAYVEAERQIEAAFAGRAIDRRQLETLIGEAEGLRARLRQIHLAAHIDTRPILSRHQRMRYDELRGYGSGHESGGHGTHGHN